MIFTYRPDAVWDLMQKTYQLNQGIADMADDSHKKGGVFKCLGRWKPCPIPAVSYIVMKKK